MFKNRVLPAAGIITGLLLSPLAQAESNFAFGNGNSATARLDFQLVIPRFLLFRVGTAGANNVDLVNFDLSGGGTELGTGTPVAATGGTGDVDVQLITNATGAIAISANAAGPLTNGGGGSISFSEILSSDTGTIPAPTLTDGASTPESFTGGVGNHTDTWTFQYANNDVPEEGTYGGAGVGTVTYTAALP